MTSSTICFRNILPQTCGSFNLNNPNGPNFINVQSFNFASIETSGFDIEASYRWPQLFGLPGTFTVRGTGDAHSRIRHRQWLAGHGSG